MVQMRNLEQMTRCDRVWPWNGYWALVGLVVHCGCNE